MLFLSRSEVEAVLDIDALVEAVAKAMSDLSSGRASMPVRVAASIASRRAMLAAMPAYLASERALTTKLVSLFPENNDRPTHQAVICCFDPENGTPLAVMDGTYITAARTAAGSALATRLLAREDARILCVLGTGVQAYAHSIAIARRPGLEKLTIAGRDPAKMKTLVARLRAELTMSVEAAPSIEEGVRSADILCAATHADAPVVRRDWLKPGVHVNSVGYNTAGQGEVDGATIRDALIVVESREAALAAPPAGAVELRLAIERDLISPEDVRIELGQLVAGLRRGRTDYEQITLYKSVGVAVQDAAAASLVLVAAQSRNAGTNLALS